MGDSAPVHRLAEPHHDSRIQQLCEKMKYSNTDALDFSSEFSTSYRYLSFDSELPLPLIPDGVGYNDGLQVPPCPDLSPYICPLRWTNSRKNVLLLLSCAATFSTAYAAGSYSPPSSLMAVDLDVSHLVIMAGITTFCLGFALAPMITAPVSEITGRRPVFVCSALIYEIFQLACAFMPTVEGMLVARFFVGVGGSVFSSVVGGVIADLWDKEERNTPMAIFSGAVLAGTGAGPLVSAALVATVGDGTLAWKWTFWHQAIMDGVLIMTIVFFFAESRASVILRRKAQRLNFWYEQLEMIGVREFRLEASLPMTKGPLAMSSGSENTKGSSIVTQRLRWVVQEDEERVSLSRMIATSIQRPFHLLFTEPVVFFFSLWAAFAWGVLYLSFSIVPFLYSSDLGMSSRVYVAMIVSSVVATTNGIVQEQLLGYRKWKQADGTPSIGSPFWAFMRRTFPSDSPEARLYFTCINGLLLPAGLFGAFLCPSSMGGCAIPVGLGFASWGIYSIYLANFNYLADTYHIYASSALAAQSFCRNIVGGVFPLVTGRMFSSLGLKGAGAVLGSIAALLTAVPWVLVFHGEKIREKSKFAIVSLDSFVPQNQRLTLQ